MVAKLAKDAGIGMPEVGYFAKSPNAFASGWNRDNALVAVSSSIQLEGYQRDGRGIGTRNISHQK